MASCTKRHSKKEINKLYEHVLNLYNQIRESDLKTIRKEWPDFQLEEVQVELTDPKHSKLKWTPDGYEYLGRGNDRVVIGLCEEHVVKIDTAGGYQTDEEVWIWKNANDKLRKYLCPILEFSASKQLGDGTNLNKGPYWIVMPTCEQSTGAIDELPLSEISEFFDVSFYNIGKKNGRFLLLDYGNLYRSENLEKKFFKKEVSLLD